MRGPEKSRTERGLFFTLCLIILSFSWRKAKNAFFEACHFKAHIALRLKSKEIFLNEKARGKRTEGFR